jgi:hypothetical protein
MIDRMTPKMDAAPRSPISLGVSCFAPFPIKSPPFEGICEPKAPYHYRGLRRPSLLQNTGGNRGNGVCVVNQIKNRTMISGFLFLIHDGVPV